MEKHLSDVGLAVGWEWGRRVSFITPRTSKFVWK
jgi:hypothetical protein